MGWLSWVRIFCSCLQFLHVYVRNRPCLTALSFGNIRQCRCETSNWYSSVKPKSWYTKTPSGLAGIWIRYSAVRGSRQTVRTKILNPLTPNDPYSGRTATLTLKRCILYIYSTDIGTEYFKRGIYSSFFFSSKCSLFHNSNVFGSCFIHVLYTGVLKLKKK